MVTIEHKTILFPTDFSPVSNHALNFAIDICIKENSKLLLLNVVDTPFSLITGEEALEIELITKDLLYFSNSNLENLKNEIIKKHDIKVEIVTYRGDTTSAISRAVVNYNANKIVMGTKTDKDLFFKTTSYIIVKNTSIPLLTISLNSKSTNFKTILFPFNEKFSTLKKADEVISFAKLYKSKVVLLGISEADTSEKIHIITNNMMQMKAVFDDNNIPCEMHFNSNNNYSQAILDYCKNNQIELITIANNLANVLKETMNVNPAKNIINKAEAPVLTIPVRD